MLKRHNKFIKEIVLRLMDNVKTMIDEFQAKILCLEGEVTFVRKGYSKA